MAEIERITITLPSDMAAVVRGAVDGGERAMQLQELAALKADIDKGVDDLANGRVRDFDAERIIQRGKRLSANRSRSI